MLATALRIAASYVLLVVTACTARDQALVGGFYGGMNENAAIEAAGVPAGSFHTEYEASLPKGDPRPPYSEKMIVASAAACMGQASELSLSFFLDKLVQVTCYPKDREAVIAALIKQGLLKASSTDFDIVQGDRRIRGSAESGRWAVTFTSRKLQEEQQAWVAKHS